MINLKYKSNDEILENFLMSVALSPYQRESWIWLAQIWFDMGDYPQAYACCQTGMRITDRKSSFECEECCWGEIPNKISNLSWERISGKIRR
jgi:hypothetical protein